MSLTDSGAASNAEAVGLRGIVTSLNTPFTSAGEVDHASLRRLVDHMVSAGMLALAVAGEGPSLTPAEYAAALATIVAQNAGRIPLIVSVTAATVIDSRHRAGVARANGADGILWQAPAGLPGVALQAAMAAVAEVGPPLFMLQDLDWHGPGLAVEEIVRLFESVPTFRCLKVETVPAGPKYSAILAATQGRLHVSGGWAVSQMLDALARGVHAFMPTEMEAIYVAIYRHFHAGDVAAARALFAELLPVIAFANQHIDVSIRFFKHLRARRGLFATEHCRPPVARLDDHQHRESERLADRVFAIESRLAGPPRARR